MCVYLLAIRIGFRVRQKASVFVARQVDIRSGSEVSDSIDSLRDSWIFRPDR